MAQLLWLFTVLAVASTAIYFAEGKESFAYISHMPIDLLLSVAS